MGIFDAKVNQICRRLLKNILNFKSNCGTCHTLKQAATHGTTGPNLNSIHPTLGAIVTQVTSGGRFMPPFGASAGGALSTTQVKNVAAFVYTSDH